MLERNGLLIITEQKSTITMSSREIADLVDADLVSVLQNDKWFEALNANTLNLNDAAILAFCLCKELQKSATSIYDQALKLASIGKFSESRELLEKIESLKKYSNVS